MTWLKRGWRKVHVDPENPVSLWRWYNIRLFCVCAVLVCFILALKPVHQDYYVILCPTDFDQCMPSFDRPRCRRHVHASGTSIPSVVLIGYSICLITPCFHLLLIIAYHMSAAIRSTSIRLHTKVLQNIWINITWLSGSNEKDAVYINYIYNSSFRANISYSIRYVLQYSWKISAKRISSFTFLSNLSPTYMVRVKSCLPEL